MNQQNKTARSALPIGSIMMRAAGVLLCLVLFSVHLMGGLYARYSSSGFAEDEARVAKFEVVVDIAEATTVKENIMVGGSGEESVRLMPDSELMKKISITNSGEVAVSYRISIESTGNLPLLFTWQDSEGNPLAVGLENGILGTQSSVTQMLHISWPKEENNYKYSDEIDNIVISIVCEQVD